MLFSNSEMAKYINDHFEPVWETVRPVPMLTIDFGNGKTITRTLHGNIATYLCNKDGRVLDIIPGIYTPEGYRERLDQFQLLARYIEFPRFGSTSPQGPNALPVGPRPAVAVKADDILRDYHRRQAELLKAHQAPDVFVMRLDRGKADIENPIKMMAAIDAAKLPKATDKSRPAKPATKAEEIARWDVLAEDTKLNETIRREMIHRKLTEAGAVTPDQIVKWLYKDVLHADLDDPYLGLGEALFKNYPFAEEEAKTARP